MTLGVFALVVSPPIEAAQVTATGISVPFFDDAGKLTHKLLARHGTRTGNLHDLREVEIHYFAPNDPTTIVQRLEARDATWDDKKQTLVGRGPVLVATPETRVTGEGFDFSLQTSLLHIHRRFVLSNRELELTSDRATIELNIERTGDEVKLRDVRRSEATGDLVIVVQPTATRSYPFEKAHSEVAIYDGIRKTVTLPRPTRLIEKGRERSVNTLTVNLADETERPGKKRP